MFQIPGISFSLTGSLTVWPATPITLALSRKWRTEEFIRLRATPMIPSAKIAIPWGIWKSGDLGATNYNIFQILVPREIQISNIIEEFAPFAFAIQ